MKRISSQRSIRITVPVTPLEVMDLLSKFFGLCFLRELLLLLGFAGTQWQMFEKEPPRRVKPLL